MTPGERVARKLGDLLGEYDIRSGNIRLEGGGQKKGFLRIKFADAWSRYCPAEDPREVPSQASQASPPRSARDGNESWDGSIRPGGTIRPALTSGNDVGTLGTDTPVATCAVCDTAMAVFEPGQTTHPGCDAP